MPPTFDLRTYAKLEAALIRHLVKDWQKRSAPIFADIAAACRNRQWNEARRRVPELDLHEVGTENKEWIKYHLHSLAVFGAGQVAKQRPSFVGVGTFETTLNQVAQNVVTYLELTATSQVQAQTLQLIAEDEAKATEPVKVAWEESQHPRDKEGQFAQVGSVTVGGREITVVKPKRARTDTLVPLDVAKFDAMFAKDRSFYLSTGGGPNAIGDRYARFGEFLSKANSIEAAEVYVGPNGGVGFTNGRHRYAWLRDHGVTTIPVAMERESLMYAKKFGYIVTQKKEFVEALHPRDPAGTPEGGQFTETGRVGEATPDPVLAIQAKEGIAKVEKHLPQAVKEADYGERFETGSWEDVDNTTQREVRETWMNEQYENGVDVDTSSLDEETRKEVQKDNQDILDQAVKDTIQNLKNVRPFKDTAPTLPLRPPEEWLEEAFTPMEFELHRVLDPDTIDYGEGEHEEGMRGEAKVALDLEALRFTSGEPLTPAEQKIVQDHWDAVYQDAYEHAVEKAFESSSYSDQRSELEQDQVQQAWDDLDDDEKFTYMRARNISYRSAPVEGAEPERWVTGVEKGAREDEDYARTHAIALKLTELRTDELRAERGLLKPIEKPTFTVETSRNHTESHPSYVAKDAEGHVIASSNTLELVTENAEQWAEAQRVNPASKIDTETMIKRVWDDWKSSSSEGLSLSMQLAIAQELGGLHRMTDDEILEATDAAKRVGGIPNLQAYVRAQWETTQMVMAKAGETKVAVYRGLMLAGERVDSTAHVAVDKSTGEPVTRSLPTNIRVRQSGTNPMITFDYGSETLQVEKKAIPSGATSIVDLPPEGTPITWETDEAAIQRRIDYYHRVSGTELIKLPELALRRAGAQSTTGTPSVANDWGGVGNLPPNPVRVVLRIEAPPTSVLSLPVYGQNMQEEHETVLIGAKDKWLWDAWRKQAPTFKTIPISTTTRKGDTVPLIIDLQDEDRNKPHWMSSVEWATVKRDYARHPAGSSQGGEFAQTTTITASYDGYQHTLTLKTREGQEIGSAKLREHHIGRTGNASTPFSKLVEFDILHIEPSARGKGAGEYLYRAAADKAKALGGTHLLGDVTSAGVLRLGIKVLGQPEYVADAINEMTVEEAMKRLEPLAPENAEGIIDTGNYLAVRWPLTKKRYARKYEVQPVALGKPYETVLKWNENEHPRDPKGSATGGQFISAAPQPDAGAGSGRGKALSSSPGQGRPDAVPAAQAIADAYNARLGLPPVQHGYVAVDEARAGTIADAYDALPLHDEDNPAVQTAYEALATEIQAQWDHITASGIEMVPWTKDGQPYRTSKEMADDVRVNQRLYFFTGGDPNRFMAKADQNGLTINDKFRAVHDFFGHAAGGYGFGARGEENAWVSHSQMLSPQARRALTTETRGQNSWVNFGRQNYHADGTYKYIPPGDRPFATQKAALLPDHYALLPWETVLKWDENKHPRDNAGRFTEVGDFTRIGMTSQRPEGDPGHQPNREVFQHMGRFTESLKAIPGVSHVSVKPGVGGWEGGSEASWQVYYRGNGRATKLVAETAKKFNQDSVLMLKGCHRAELKTPYSGEKCVPNVELSFASGVSKPMREQIEQVVVEEGITGWTWVKREGKTLLRMVSVPQWGSDPAAHQVQTKTISQRLRELGAPNHRRVRKVRVQVMDRDSYDRYINP
jgi:GNAT superfamily N-acetyltransferase